MSSGIGRAERLREMERLYTERGFTDAQMAERLGVDRTTIFRDRATLEAETPFEEVEPGRYKIDRKRYLSNIRVNLHEALALYLATRRLSRQTHAAQPHVANALEKLALALKQPMTERLVASANAILRQSAQPEQVKVWEAVAQGWVERFKVRINYRALHAREAKIHLVSPYLIEPALWSDGAYVVGHSDVTNSVIPFRMERIEQAFVTAQSFTVPETFDEAALLKHAWGIWYSDQGPEIVKLKFTGNEAVRRVKESRWHPLQKPLVDTPDGGCIWEAPIAEWQEMLPWIRGWGANCEVVEPRQLWEELRGEAEKLARMYGIAGTKPILNHWLLWAKTNRPQNDRLHLLICHLIDVGNVALVMWERVFTSQFKQQIADALHLDPDRTGRLIAFIAAMHDLGKACPYFQAHIGKHPALRSHYEEIVNAGFKPENTQSCSHGFVSTAALVDLLQSTVKLPREFAIPIAVAVGGHHGRWPTANEWGDQSACAGGGVWKTAREALVADVKQVFNPPIVAQYSLDQETQNMLLIALSGITSVTDWLGSMENHFGYWNAISDLDKYNKEWSQKKAQETLSDEHWTDWQPPNETMSFVEQFKHAHITEPRGAQPFIIELAEKLDKPSLVIIEDATGSGKTEAAWYLADHWTRVLGNRGVYVAMPTMATSNSLHDRVAKFLKTRYPNTNTEPILVHSQARFADDEPERKMQSNDDADQTSKGSEVNALAWFEDKRKRSLLAPFGVGTVDQTFLSVLQTNHFFVRLFALGRKTVIFDEVHAYDTYMTEIFQTLLRWLRVMGSSAIILSATLPVATRRKLVEAYGGDASKASDTESSSLVTWVSNTTTEQKPLPLVERSPVRVEWIEHSPEAIATQLRDEMREGGCVAVICNRVARAQEVYRAVKDAFKDDARFIPGDNVLLFHARFPMGWRNEIEKLVLKQANKDSTREHPFLVVATQVIEQSLDLDFDLMITDLPPVDLLIQRVGRLHRHKEHDGLRPDAMKTPRVLITKPEREGEVPHFGNDERIGKRGGVYERFILLRTRLELKSREQNNALALALPAQSRELVEAVYAGEDKMPDFSAFTQKQQVELQESWKQMDKAREEAQDKADTRLIPNPHRDDLLERCRADLVEDDPKVHETFQAFTRDVRPSISLVCLHEISGGAIALDPNDASSIVNINQKPNGKQTKALVKNAVSVNRNDMVRYFGQQSTPQGWREHALLKEYRAVIFKSDVYEAGDFSLQLSRELGLEIITNK